MSSPELSPLDTDAVSAALDEALASVTATADLDSACLFEVGA